MLSLSAGLPPPNILPNASRACCLVSVFCCLATCLLPVIPLSILSNFGSPVASSTLSLGTQLLTLTPPLILVPSLCLPFQHLGSSLCLTSIMLALVWRRRRTSFNAGAVSLNSSQPSIICRVLAASSRLSLLRLSTPGINLARIPRMAILPSGILYVPLKLSRILKSKAVELRAP